MTNIDTVRHVKKSKIEVIIRLSCFISLFIKYVVVLADEMIVEVGDFSRIRRHYYPSNKITLYPVNAIYLAPG